MRIYLESPKAAEQASPCCQTKERTVPEIQSKLAVKVAMTGQKCVVCGNTKASDPSVSFHRVPKNPGKRAEWLERLQLREDSIKSST